MDILKKSKKNKATASRRKRHEEEKSVVKTLLDTNRLLSTLLFLGFTGLVILVCFVGLSPTGPQILPNQVARIRVVAAVPFNYESEILTAQRIEQRRKQVPPVYRLVDEPYHEFERYIQRLTQALDRLSEEMASASPAERVAVVQKFIREFEPNSPYKLNSEDIVVVLNALASPQRNKIIQESLSILREIYLEGIYDSEHAEIKTEKGTLSFYTIHQDSGRVTQVQIQSAEEAMRFLRINLSTLAIQREASTVLYRLLRSGLTPNLVYDPVKSKEKIEEAIESVKPVEIEVKQGQTVIEPGTKVTPLDLEKLAAYQQKLKADPNLAFSFDALLWEQILMTFAILLSAVIYLRVNGRQLHQNLQPILLSVTVILLNLALMRLILELGEGDFGQNNLTLTAVLPYLAPTALGPIILTILIGSGSGILAALLISLFNALMQGSSIPILIVSFLSSLVGIYFCRNIQVRTRVVRAGALAGFSVAISAFFLGLRDALDLIVISQQVLVGQIIGVVTGIAVVGLLPILEHLFKYTTDISMLELTDFNHPLLRHMQVTAPGSYHHSLMVANLSENAAATIGANPLICRVCSLFHDIGKTIKPEYFSENQREGINPHLQKNPSMSALVIKSHVKEGVSLALQHKLPKLIIDVIKQHHGTTLIQYFYYKALRQKGNDLSLSLFPNAPKIDIDEVNESTYRYDGPKPQFKESAIIFFADSIEAASRSLPKVTPQAVDEMLDRIFQERLDDNQLSECPLTFDECNKIKKSFSFTLLNMLHARVEYPSKEEQKEAGLKRQEKEQKAAVTKKVEPKTREVAEPVAATSKATGKKTVPHATQEEKAAPYSDNQPV